MTGWRLYWRYMGISMRAQMQYRASFVMLAIGHMAATGIEFVGVWALFARFGSLRGWSLAEVALFYGLINIAFALAEAFARGFDTFEGLIRRGDFDRLMLRPRSTMLQVAASEVSLFRVGRLTQGLAVLVWAMATLGLAASPERLALVGLTVVGGACLFSGLFVGQAVLSFWTVETLELVNTVTYGGTETAQYPLTIYRPWFRRFFTYVIPLACVSYFPALAILGRPDPVMHSPLWFRWTAPLIGVAFLLIALQAWRIGVRHYRSTGS